MCQMSRALLPESSSSGEYGVCKGREAFQQPHFCSYVQAPVFPGPALPPVAFGGAKEQSQTPVGEEYPLDDIVDQGVSFDMNTLLADWQDNGLMMFDESESSYFSSSTGTDALGPPFSNDNMFMHYEEDKKNVRPVVKSEKESEDEDFVPEEEDPMEEDDTFEMIDDDDDDDDFKPSRKRRGRKQRRNLAASKRAAFNGPVQIKPEIQASKEQSEIVEFMERVQNSGLNAQPGIDELQSGDKIKFTCTHPGCKREFLWKWAMEEHAATHTSDKERTHICSYCGKGFLTLGCMRSHMRIHTRKPFAYGCKVPGCPKKYCTSEGLRLHMRNVHDDAKKWECPSAGCDKAFVRQSDLRLHIIRIHSKERPYPCSFDDCTKSFACFSELKRHLNSHRKSHGAAATEAATAAAAKLHAKRRSKKN